MTPSMKLVRRYIEAYNAIDIDAMLACFSYDVVFENISNSNGVLRLEGIEALRAQAESIRSAFSSRTQTIIDSVENQDRIAIQISYEATVAVDLPNGLKAGQKLALRGCSFFTMVNDSIERLVDFS